MQLTVGELINMLEKYPPETRVMQESYMGTFFRDLTTPPLYPVVVRKWKGGNTYYRANENQQLEGPEFTIIAISY